jgi:hypothetical protein
MDAELPTSLHAWTITRSAITATSTVQHSKDQKLGQFLSISAASAIVRLEIFNMPAHLSERDVTLSFCIASDYYLPAERSLDMPKFGTHQ